MTTVTVTSAITIRELQVSVFELDAAVARARLLAEREVRRDTAFVKFAWYHLAARRAFNDVEPRIRAIQSVLTQAQLRELSDLVVKPIHPITPLLTTVQAHRHQLRWPERRVFDSFTGLIESLQRLGADLAAEAAKRPSPRLTARMNQDAILASAWLQPVKLDVAEGDPDPDYGF